MKRRILISCAAALFAAAGTIVEQNPRLVLPMSDKAIVLNQGAVTHAGQAEALLANVGLMEELLGVGMDAPVKLD